MTPEKVQKVVRHYRCMLDARGILGRRIVLSATATPDTALAHARYMCDEIGQRLQEGRIEKAHRHLGFLQAIIWAQGLCTLEELMNDNKPNEAEHDPTQ